MVNADTNLTQTTIRNPTQGNHEHIHVPQMQNTRGNACQTGQNPFTNSHYRGDHGTYSYECHDISDIYVNSNTLNETHLGPHNYKDNLCHN